MTMVERVSRAIWLAYDVDMQAKIDGDDFEGACDLLARAAIAAMREPSEAIKRRYGGAEDDWIALIDAALADADLPTDATGVE